MEERYPLPFNPKYTITKTAKIFNPQNEEIHQFNSNGYKQVCIMPIDGGRRRIFGVHQLMAMTFLPEYSSDCVVHHKDHNKSNNNLNNLECKTRSEHSREHADPSALQKYIIYYGPANKGVYTSTNEKTIKARNRNIEKKLANQINITDFLKKIMGISQAVKASTFDVVTQGSNP